MPVHVAKGLTAKQRRAYRLADNRTGEETGWIDELLAEELGDLGDLAEFTGFDDAELDRLLGPGEGMTDEDDAPAAPEAPVTRPGDLWHCGAHRVLCGDATQREAVVALLGGAKPHLMVTDPPYGVNYDPKWRRNIRNTFADVKADGSVPNDDVVDWRGAWELFGGEVAYVWHGGKHAAQVQRSLEAASFETRAQIIWAKQTAPITRGHYRWQHEPCWYAVRKGGTGHWHGDRSQTTVWEIHNLNTVGGASRDPGDQNEKHHGAQKPVECMRRPIVNNSARGDAVYDPFLGSGTTMIAAETEGRVCYGIEIDPGYCDVAVRRWEAFTGETAEREVAEDVAA